MKRSLVILLTAVSISAMTAGTAFPAFAEATEAEAEETTDGAENAADSELEDGVSMKCWSSALMVKSTFWW